MKFALNGALTIGTLDGANVEIAERVGDENIFIFGLTAEEVTARRQITIDSADYIAASPALAEVLASVSAGVFSPDEPGRYRGLVDALRYHDYFLVCADFDSYYKTQRRVGDLWRHPDQWWKGAILNTANVGWFSSDRSIREYARDVWDVPAFQAPG
jgi:starch phosphorylase